jgi:Domain of unknown function (DUF4390)
MRCWRSARSLGLALLLAVSAGHCLASGIEPLRASLTQGEDGYTLAAQFAVDLGPHLQEAVSHGITLTFNLEFELNRPRWYWLDEHVAGVFVTYRLSYNALTRQYRLAVGGLHQNFDSFDETLQVLGHVAALPVADKSALKPGQTYDAALRLSLDKTQLPKPFQVDAIANSDWNVEAKVLRWQYTAPGGGK